MLKIVTRSLQIIISINLSHQRRCPWRDHCHRPLIMSLKETTAPINLHCLW